MNNEIRLLDASLLSDKRKLKEISYWLKVMNRPNGWHYDLDQIWIINELEKANIRPGSTILDAGAGQGIMQYLLAARGYDIISLDFSPRTKPSRSLGIFNIKGEGDSDIEYQHPFMKFISYGEESSGRLANKFSASNIKKIPLLPQRAVRRTTSLLLYMHERFVINHAGYGTITYLRAPFHDVPLESKSIDTVISISAIEHADIDLFNNNVFELLRLIKPKAPLLMTTSAVLSGESIYLEEYAGWCFSLSALKTFFPDCKIEFGVEDCARSIIESDIFKKRLDPYYYLDENSFCYRREIRTLPYLPVAVKVVK